MADTFYSPTGNPEVWDEKPEGYQTVAEWFADHHSMIREPNPEELKASFRAARAGKLDMIYDKAISQLNRKLALASTEADKAAVQEQINDWHLWAEYLCDMPTLAGFPWDGGFASTPWPEQPVIVTD